MRVRKGENIFNLILLVVFLLAIVMSFSYNPLARMFPLLFGLIAFLLLFLYFLFTNMKIPPKFLRFIGRQGALSGIDGTAKQTRGDEEEDVSWKEAFLIFACLAGYVLIMAWVDYLLATLIYLLLFLRFAGSVSWKTSIIFSLLVSGCLYGLFELLLGQ
ncbi:hypothetical protein BSNK01_29980 [Bacillaceae bacterium]